MVSPLKASSRKCAGNGKESNHINCICFECECPKEGKQRMRKKDDISTVLLLNAGL
jgi:hypothetical protein